MRVTVEQQLEWVLSGIGRTGDETLPLELAHGRTLAEDVRSRHDLPLWDNSAMDGYALRSSDVASASEETPVLLAVTGEVLAGSGANPAIAPGCAVRIMTGAPVPDDADAVVPVEQTLESGAPAHAHRDGANGTGRPNRAGASVWERDEVRIARPLEPGAHIRRRGEDTAAGTVIGERGDPLTAVRLAALAAAGIAEARVGRLPRVGVLVTGAELRDPASDLERGQIPESNSVLVTGLLRECGVPPLAVRRSGDDATAVAALLDELALDCDVIVSTGGIGPGSRDVVRIALDVEPGVRQSRVAMRPGQPQCAGRLASGAWLFALPGNPVSAAVGFELFVRPALLAMQGRRDILRRRVPAVAEVAWRGAADRLQVLPVTVSRGGSGRSGASGASGASGGMLRCRPAVDPRGVSHAVGGLGAAQGYALVEAARGDVAAGERVDVILVEP